MAQKSVVSIISPVYNEGEGVEAFYAAVVAVITPLAEEYEFEILFTDNCSTDTTFEKLSAIVERDDRVRVIRFSRNFGYQRSILTGYLNAVGDAVIQLDADLEDPPSIIPEFIEKWRDGFNIVHGYRRSRREGPILHFTRRAFYRLINALSEVDLPYDVGDCRLVDRRVIEELRNVTDQNPYLRGTIAAFGYRQTKVAYDRAKRTTGESKFALLNLAGLAIDGIVSQSIIPLRLATFCGLLIFILSGLSMFGFLIGKIFFGADWHPGFPTTIILILMGIGINALFFGIVGEYVGRIYRNSQRLPITIIDKTAGEIKYKR